MLRFIGSRLLWAIPVTLFIVVGNFLLTRLVPGDPINALIGDFPAPAGYVAQLRQDFGLDEPIHMQLYYYLLNLFSGNFGYSFFNRLPVLEVIGQRVINTLILMTPALVISSILGVLLGMLAATRRKPAVDVAITALTLLGKSVPTFWLGQVLIILLAVQLRWLPAQGMQSLRAVAPGLPAMWDLIAHWIMPGTVLIIFNLAVVARVARVSFKDALQQDFVVTAKAAGLPNRQVLFRHVLPNAMIPIVTVIGNNLANILTGTIIVEAVFGWPGIGSLFIDSIAQRDYPVLQAIFLLLAISTILANLITDIAYAALDPRVRSTYGKN